MTMEYDDLPSAVAADIEGMLPYADNDLFKEFISSIVKECVRSGARMIGHVKANVRSGHEVMSMSSTTDDGNVRVRSPLNRPAERYSMTVNVIVYGIDEKTVSKIIGTQRKILGENKITIFSDTRCSDPDCSDPECTDRTHRIIRLF